MSCILLCVQTVPKSSVNEQLLIFVNDFQIVTDNYENQTNTREGHDIVLQCTIPVALNPSFVILCMLLDVVFSFCKQKPHITS